MASATTVATNEAGKASAGSLSSVHASAIGSSSLISTSRSLPASTSNTTGTQSEVSSSANVAAVVGPVIAIIGVVLVVILVIIMLRRSGNKNWLKIDADVFVFHRRHSVKNESDMKQHQDDEGESTIVLVPQITEVFAVIFLFVLGVVKSSSLRKFEIEGLTRKC